MKLKSGFVLHETAGEHIAVATGAIGETFNGLIRNNTTAAFIFQQLMEDTTEEKIVEAMQAEYDAPKDVLAADVHKITEQLREAGFLDE